MGKDETLGGRKKRDKKKWRTRRDQAWSWGALAGAPRKRILRIPKPIRSVRDPKDMSSIRVPSAFAIVRAAICSVVSSKLSNNHP